jgi:hypothetical protein
MRDPIRWARPSPTPKSWCCAKTARVRAPNEPGELVHRGVHVSQGYWNDPAKTAERFKVIQARQSGLVMPEVAVWSGDTVRMDEDGFLYFISRRDEMIKTSGYRVSPTEVEEVVYGTDQVGECAAFGIAHPQLGQAIVVVASAKPLRQRRSGSRTIAHCKETPAVVHGAAANRDPPNRSAAQRQRQDRPQNPGRGTAQPVSRDRAMKAGRPTHWPMTQFPVIDDCLWVGGIPLTQLARRVGQTPFYAYDRRLLDERVTLLRRSLPAAIELHYAIKANPMPALVQHLAGLVDGLDIASLGELKVALDAGMAPDAISFAGPGKRAGGTGRRHRRRHHRQPRIGPRTGDGGPSGPTQGRRPRVAVRVNPDFELKIRRHEDGRRPQAVRRGRGTGAGALRRIGELALNFQGFPHFQRLAEPASRKHCRGARPLLRAGAAAGGNDAPSPVRLLNVGGGFGIPYFPGESRHWIWRHRRQPGALAADGQGPAAGCRA